MTTDRLDQIEARIEAATPGPWEVFEGTALNGNSTRGICQEGDDETAIFEDRYIGAADAEFIAHAPTDLAATSRALRAVLAALDDYPLPSRLADPTGAAVSALEGLESIIRTAITTALEGNQA